MTVFPDSCGPGVMSRSDSQRSIPTGFTFYKSGIIVVQAPHTLYLQDTDGDGQADKRTVLFSGWHTGDTHAGPSNLRWGFDNWIYGIVGY